MMNRAWKGSTMHDTRIHTDLSGAEGTAPLTATATTNAPGTLATFLQRYVFFGHGFDEIGCYPHGRLVQTPVLRTYENTLWQDFYRLHDNFQGLQEKYRRFRAEYGNHQGPLTGAVAHESRVALQDASVGDLEGLFSPLDQSVLPSARHMSSYHLVPPVLQQVYEGRLREGMTGVDEYHSKLGLNIVSFAETLWRMHAQPELFLSDISELLRLELAAAGHHKRVFSYEYALAYNGTSNHQLFDQHALRQLQSRHRGRSWRFSLRIPSLEGFRRMLPADIDMLDMFRMHGDPDAQPIRTALQRITQSPNLYQRGERIEHGVSS